MLISRKNKTISRKKIFFSSSLIIIILSASVLLSGYQANKTTLIERKSQKKNKENPLPKISVNFDSVNSINTVKISAGIPEAEIYYTLDCSTPNLFSKRYNSPVKIPVNKKVKFANISTSKDWLPPLNNDITKATILKVRIYVKKKGFSETVTKTILNNPNYCKNLRIPIISIVCKENDFFGNKKGIMVMGKSYEDKDRFTRKNINLEYLRKFPYRLPANYTNKGKDWHRKISFEIFTPSENFSSIKAKTRIYGGFSRTFSQKSLKLMFEKKEDSKEFSKLLNSGNDTLLYKELLLRAWGSDAKLTLFRDALANSLLSGTDLLMQKSSPVIVLINGEYWGIYNLREYMSPKNLALLYNEKEKNISVNEINYGISLKNNSDSSFIELVKYISENDIKKQKNYIYIEQILDIDKFIDYFIIESYTGNHDWVTNCIIYKVGKRGKWCFYIKDLDASLSGHSRNGRVQINLFERVRPVTVGKIFFKLIENNIFKEKFIEKYNFLVKNNLSTENILNKTDYFTKQLSPFMIEQINRWRSPISYKTWLNNIEKIKYFAQKRQPVYQNQINKILLEIDTISTK